MNCLSHPVWVRGLKLIFHRFIAQAVLSHPVWVRGLKHLYFSLFIYSYFVAPRVGAWIETSSLAAVDALSRVAPRVGAWIETVNTPIYDFIKSKSHPVWVRGLKQERRHRT